MADSAEQKLEEELRTIWTKAGNTRKRTADWRIKSILDSSRAELSLRELLMFFIYSGQAFLMLGAAVLQSFAPGQTVQDKRQDNPGEISE